MSRNPAFGALFAATVLLAAPAFAGDTAYGDGPAITLIRNGLAGEGNQLEKPPAIAVKVGDFAFVPGTTTFGEIVGKFGSEMHSEGTGGDAFIWACYVSPASNTAPSTLIWFGTNWSGDAKSAANAFAYEPEPTTIPSGCAMLEQPVTIVTGIPGPGATMAEVEAVFGPKPNMEADGTVAWFFGSVPKGDGINVTTKELKYRIVDGKVVAAEFGVFNELE